MNDEKGYTLISRETAIGRMFLIGSTFYSEKEILDLAFSVCEGMTEDGDEFLFNSQRWQDPFNGKYGVSNLGCLPTRTRDGVLMCRDDIVKYAICRIAHLEKDSQNPLGTSGAFFVAFHIAKVQLHRCQLEKDKWTGNEYYFHECRGGFFEPTYRFQRLGWHEDTTCSYGKYYVTESFDDAIDKIAEYCKPLLILDEENEQLAKEE